MSLLMADELCRRWWLWRWWWWRWCWAWLILINNPPPPTTSPCSMLSHRLNCPRSAFCSLVPGVLVRSILWSPGSPFSISSACSGTKSLFASRWDTTHAPFRCVFCASDNDWCGTLSPVPMSDILCMFDGHVYVNRLRPPSLCTHEKEEEKKDLFF